MNIPENYVKLGAVGFSPKGEWNAETTYNRYDVVYHQGSSYIVLNDNVVGSNPDTDTTNYMIMAKGVDPDNFQENLKPYLVNNGVTTEEGFALDARYGKVLADEVGKIKSTAYSYYIGGDEQWIGAKDPTRTITVDSSSPHAHQAFLVLVAHNGGNKYSLFGVKNGCVPILLAGDSGATMSKTDDGYTFTLTVNSNDYPYYSVSIFGAGDNVSIS